jgi:hypothetical protein
MTNSFRNQSYIATDGQSASSSWCKALSLSGITFFLLHVRCPLWREDGSVMCSAITYWLESCRTHNQILLSHLRQPNLEVEIKLQLTVSQSVCQGIEPTLGLVTRYYFCARRLLSESCRLVSLGRPLWREVGSVTCHSQSVVIYQYLCYMCFTIQQFI